jgi:hypothetical protein
MGYHTRVSLLYRDPDGKWPKVPKGHEVGDCYVSNRNGKSAQWKRLYYPLDLKSEDEVLMFLVAYEAFRYLRRMKQVPGRYGEIEADAFTLITLEQYRDGPKQSHPTSLNHLAERVGVV